MFVRLEEAHIPNKVPDVSGMSVKDAEATLTATKLTLRKTSVEPSATVQSGNVKRTVPKAGDDVNDDDPVDLVISSGSRNWLPVAFMGLAGLLLVSLGVPLSTGVLLERLANQDTARGLITFLIAVTAAALFIIMGVSTIVQSDAPDADKQFDRGKQVLTMLIGILGTIVGFYYGTAGNPPQTPLKVVDLTVDKPLGLWATRCHVQRSPRRSALGDIRQWLISAIKITIGIGTPSNKSRIERMVNLLNKVGNQRSQPTALNDNNMISLSAPNGRGKTGAERAN
jgi:hypothetical protein